MHLERTSVAPRPISCRFFTDFSADSLSKRRFENRVRTKRRSAWSGQSVVFLSPPLPSPRGRTIAREDLIPGRVNRCGSIGRAKFRFRGENEREEREAGLSKVERKVSGLPISIPSPPVYRKTNCSSAFIALPNSRYSTSFVFPPSLFAHCSSHPPFDR